MGIQPPTQPWKWQVLVLFLYCNQNEASGNLHYSVVEEGEEGTLVGNLANDLGIDIAVMSERRIKVRSSGSGQYFAVDQQSGTLTLHRSIDRESVCGPTVHCLLVVEIVLENPLELHLLEIEILDINDNSPKFLTTGQVINITELLAYPGARIPLEEAHDRDSGDNGVRKYSLSPNPYFSLSLKTQEDGKLSPEMVIEKALDREEIGEHHLILTAFDGGNPPRSGTSQITVTILDFNDNVPTFSQSIYKIHLLEGSPLHTTVIQLNSTDLDEGSNAEIEYFFDVRTPVSIRQLFSINPDTGVIITKGMLDYETSNYYEITVRAKDKGTPQMEGSSIIQIEIGDINDHVPEIQLTSLIEQIPEDAMVGATVGLFSVTDLDAEQNGEVELTASPNLPFKIKSFKDYYALIIEESLDREEMSQYEIILTGQDMGSPSLSTQTTILVNITDINDNAPLFLNQDLNCFIHENNEPGRLLYLLSAFDPDEGSNADFRYSLVETQLHGQSVSSLVSINSISGEIYAQTSFDYEQFQVLEILVKVEDSGEPRLSSNTTVFVFVLDTNDNPPNLLHPKHNGDFIARLNISRYVPVGYLVTKVSAVDSDSGHNALLSYNFAKPIDMFLFNVSGRTGEIRTTRNFLTTDGSLQKLVLSITDNGKPSLSITVTILLSLEDSIQHPTSNLNHFLSGNRSDITLYLVISLVAICLASLVTSVILLVKCFKKEPLCWHPCWCLHGSPSEHSSDVYHPSFHFNMDGTLKYMETRVNPPNPDSHYYRTYLSPGKDDTDLTLVKQMTLPTVKDLINNTESLGINNSANPFEQAQPNTDWRFSQAQRPGPSGAQQPTEEAGVWPNNQFETERLQAMILASANEAAEGGAAVGGGNGTMGLSARYGPQFTLQHVPDYRQNIYIPGTTSTLTNAAGKRDGKSGGPSGNKKKSSKKEKK